MSIKILYDNKSIDKTVLSGWGFSCLIGNDVLFDTGNDGKSLLSNMKKMRINTSLIRHIVISHDHWDHSGGLETLLKKGKDLQVYGCEGFNRDFKAILQRNRVKSVTNKYVSSINGFVYTTGSFIGQYKNAPIEEQSVFVKTKNGISIITGCAHPGILKIVRHIKKMFPQDKIYSVSGGFHLKDMKEKDITNVCDDLMKMGIKKVGPAHCSGKKAQDIFKDKFKTDFIEISAGTEFEV